MRLSKKTALITIAVILIVIPSAIYYYVAQKKTSAENSKQGKTPIVKIGSSEQKNITVTLSLNGNVTPIQTVEVRPQIQNIVQTIHVKEGQEVKAGQLLFSLDDRSDNANLAKARAQLAKDQSELNDAKTALKRSQDLLAQQFIATAAVDTAKNRVDAANAVVHADQAAVLASQIAVGYNKINASISGRIGIINLHKGSLAQPTTTMLTITQIDPIAVSFAVPESALSAILTSYPKMNAPVTLITGDNETLTGQLSLIDNTVDASTGTVRMKAQFSNPKKILWPGAFVRVNLTTRTINNATVVPAQAIITGPNTQFIYVVDQTEKVQIQTVNVLHIEDGQAVISGLEPGKRIVIEGMQQLRPGIKVKTATHDIKQIK